MSYGNCSQNVKRIASAVVEHLLSRLTGAEAVVNEGTGCVDNEMLLTWEEINGLAIGISSVI